MITALEQLYIKYNLSIESPFSIKIQDKEHIFQCLIRGYGAKLGMVIDKDWEKIEPVANDLIEMGFGFSCFDIEGCKVDEGDSFQKVLDDWGKIDNILPSE